MTSEDRVRELVAELVGAGQRVLELGSGDATPDGVYDVVVAVDVLDRLKDPVAALSAVRPALARGGYVVASVRNVAHGDRRLALLGGQFADGGALRFYTRQSLVETLAAAGFTAVHVDAVEAGVGPLAPAAGRDAGALADLARAVGRAPDARVERFVAVAYPSAAVAGTGGVPALVARLSGERDDARAALERPWRAYLELLARSLLREGFGQPQAPVRLDRLHLPTEVGEWLRLWLDGNGFEIVHREPPTEWPSDAETMIGRARLDNLVACVEEVVRNGVAGDLIETGVWRGGASIMMRAVLRALGDETRTVWVADSFAGLPKPEPDRYPADANDPHWTFEELIVGLDEVKANFAKYGLLDDQVRFVPGWFEDTLPTVPVERLAVLRLDGDLYSSTITALEALYPKLSVGGYAIIDDYGAIPACRAAVEDYRAAHGITEPLRQTDYTEMYWRRER